VSNPLLDHEHAQEPVRFSALWRGMAGLAFAMLSFITVALFTWGVWVTVTVYSHGELLAVLQERSTNGRSSMTNSVNVGSTGEAETLEASARTWLTTREVAEREGCDERTVINYIAAGQIEPVPVKVGKSWQIAENFRIIPKDAETGGTVANAKLKPEEDAKP
jgi:hypothetical protein